MKELSEFFDLLRSILEIPRVFQEFQEIKERLRVIEEKIEPQKSWYTRKDCIEFRGISKGMIEVKPYLLPCFGIPEETIPCHKWSQKTFEKWKKRTLKEIEGEWNSMPKLAQQKYISIRKAA